MIPAVSWKRCILGKRAVGLAIALLCAGFVASALLAQGGGLTVTATCGDFVPNPVVLGDTAQASLNATASNVPNPGECVLNPPTWSWTITNVLYSDGVTIGPSPGGDKEWITQGSPTDPKATLYFTFSDNEKDGGFWIITCRAEVTYTDNCGHSW